MASLRNKVCCEFSGRILHCGAALKSISTTYVTNELSNTNLQLNKKVFHWLNVLLLRAFMSPFIIVSLN